MWEQIRSNQTRSAVLVAMLGVLLLLLGYFLGFYFFGSGIGGVIIALSFIHIILAFGKDFAFKKLDQLRASILESLGAVMFLVIALLGFSGGYFFLNFLKKDQNTLDLK